MKSRLLRAALVLAPLGLIGAGAGMIYLPAGLLAVGMLLWIDTMLWDLFGSTRGT